MLHTFNLYFPLGYEEIQNIQRRFNLNYREVNKFFEKKFPGTTISVSNKGGWKLYFVVDAVKLLGTPHITENDYPRLRNELKLILWNVLGNSDVFKDHVLLRVDYRYDAIVTDEKERTLLMFLYKKLTKSYRFQKKYLGGKNVNGSYEPYKTTVYHSSKSVNSTVYLKDEEREHKSIEPEEYERNVIRYEVRLLRNHLDYKARSETKGCRPRKLWAYMKDEVYKESFENYMAHIYHPGKFYKLDEARKIISQSKLFTQNMKAKLTEFLKKVSSHDMDTPKNKIKSPKTYKNRLEAFYLLQINPVLIPKNYPQAPFSLLNPLDDFFNRK